MSVLLRGVCASVSLKAGLSNVVGFPSSYTPTHRKPLERKHCTQRESGPDGGLGFRVSG